MPQKVYMACLNYSRRAAWVDEVNINDGCDARAWVESWHDIRLKILRRQGIDLELAEKYQDCVLQARMMAL